MLNKFSVHSFIYFFLMRLEINFKSYNVINNRSFYLALKKISLIIFILFLFNNKLIAQETRWIDDIVPNEVLDGTSFKLCNNENQVIQYFFGSNGGVEYN